MSKTTYANGNTIFCYNISDNFSFYPSTKTSLGSKIIHTDAIRHGFYTGNDLVAGYLYLSWITCKNEFNHPKTTYCEKKKENYGNYDIEGTPLTIPSIYAHQRYECLMAFPGVHPV